LCPIKLFALRDAAGKTTIIAIVKNGFMKTNDSCMNEALCAELADAVSARLQALPDKPEETPEATVRALWHTAAGMPLSAQRACRERLPVLSEQGSATLYDLIERRLKGTPLAHLTGRQHFMQTELVVYPGALIPRKETELLGYTALNILDDIMQQRVVQPQIIDLCTGSGNLACAIAVHRPEVRVTGSDISIAALNCAMENRRILGLHAHVAFVAADMLTSFVPEVCRQRTTMIVCNPPYISSAKLANLPGEIILHEPSEAFNGGPIGVSLLNRLVKEGSKYIMEGGWICCEAGRGQGDWLAQRFEKTAQFQQVRRVCDTDGHIRVVAAQRHAAG
jgi:release factor glutamine methyltransferase